ncbi:phosphatase PAP2 family protein [Leeia sp. TBRC 13508]|uniref:Phosphatase PAP2 family protein n=1 Tax=Leeia speluncae TaxID=2884804 RepID=A0ABS8D1T8_9NEIS|nr:phosphatase PAP2 family protein [Leeia speluncae]MCB6181946.1 phosphatase PAP2 family protein [Leeia speluncae]
MQKSPYHFYIKQIIVLIVSALVLISLFDLTPLDTMISDWFFDPITKHFPLRDQWFLETVMHKWVKYALLMWGAWLVIRLIRPGVAKHLANEKRRTVGFLLASLLLVPTVVGVMKHYSERPCPWDSTRYGGAIPHITLFESLPAGTKLGRCFPGGHASGGFGLMALVLLARKKSKIAAVSTFVATFGLGMLMGAGQVLRGAHFVSHNFWSAWVAWVVILILYWLFIGRYEIKQSRSNISAI